MKDNLGDINSSDNYCNVVSGSVLLKLLDLVIIIREGNKLNCDPLQFEFQPQSGTILFSWPAYFVVDYFN